MPIYKYICFKCKASFELLLRMKHRNNLQICPACGEHSGERAMETAKFKLEGKGFYKSKKGLQ